MDLIQVLALHGIECLEYHGGMSEIQRTRVLQAFRSDPNAPRVLLLSNVGATGLNLDTACNLLIPVRSIIPFEVVSDNQTSAIGGVVVCTG